MFPMIAVVGPGDSDAELDRLAVEVGRRLAEAGATIVCGGLGGVMAAACRGAAEVGGLCIGLLPGEDASQANPWVSVSIPTGLGEMRNALIVRSADVVVAIGGGYGTLSEIALALRLGKPVVGLGTWELVRPDHQPDDGVFVERGPADAVRRALSLIVR
jgi:uncharacterized protein (TIGR00725 family)